MCVLAQVGLPKAINDRFAIVVDAFPPDGRKRDLDNLCKATLDALTHAKVWADDSQLQESTWRWGDRIQGGSLKVRITTI